MLSRGLETEIRARARGTARRRVGSPYRSCTEERWVLDSDHPAQQGLLRCEAIPSFYSEVPSRLSAVPPVSLTRWPNVRRPISAPISSPMAMSAIPSTATPCRGGHRP